MHPTNIQEILVKSVLRKFYLDKLNYSNLEKLAQIIKKSDFGFISSNTLARIAGLRTDKRKTYEYNLDVLSKIIGLGTYQNFERFIQHKSKVKINDFNEESIDLTCTYISLAAENNDLKFFNTLERFIETRGIETINFFNIGNALMIGCRNNKTPRKIIDYSTSSPILTQLFYETYVDMDYLNGYFGEAMITLSSLNSSNNSTLLFSNSIAYICERNRNKVSTYKKRGNFLLDFDKHNIDKLIAEKYIYPVARWLRVCIDFCLINNDPKKAIDFFEYALSLMMSLPSDDVIILISEISEIDVSILPVQFLSKLKDIFLQKGNLVNYEYDCYLNAALNISLKLGCDDLINYSTASNLFNNHPLKFVTRSNTILNKIQLLPH